MANDEKRGVNIANGVISGLVVTCGIIYSALCGVYIDSVLASVTVGGISTVPLWSIGFAYIVPGLLGLIGTCTKLKCAYIVQMVFCILTLLAMGIFVIISLVALTALTYVSAGCRTVSQASCTITSTSFYAVVYSISISMVLGWVLTLVITILGGILACRRPTSPGQVMVPMTPMTVVSTTTNMQPAGYQYNLGYSDNWANNQGTGYPDNRAYTQGSGYNYPDNRSYTGDDTGYQYLDNRSYKQGSSYPDNRSYAQGSGYPDNRSYKQGSSYPDNRSYAQGSGYPDNRSYKQSSSYPDNRSYSRDTGYLDNTSYAQGSDYPTRDWRAKY